MADSDDEYDRKRRDKFRGERTEGYSRESRRGSTEGRRDDYEREDNWSGGRAISRPSRPEYRDYRGGGGRDRYSPTPPIKRFKPEGWDDRRYAPDYGYPYAHAPDYPDRPYPPPLRRVEPPVAAASSADTQPAMMSFKAFLAQQDDAITDEEALAKYNEYKLEFKRQQLNEFFVTHKDEEWFKFKYHPEDSVKRKEEQLNYLKQRVTVFTEFLNKGLLNDIRLDSDQMDVLVRLMDRLVIRLEGGSEVDWLALEAEEVAKPKEEPTLNNDVPVVVDGSDDEKEKPEIKKEPKDPDEEEKEKKEDGEDGEDVEKPDKEKKKKEEEVKEDAKNENEKEENDDEKSTSGKRKRGSGYGSDSGSGSDGEISKKDEKKDTKKKNGHKGEKKSGSASPSTSQDDVTEVEHKRKDLHKTASVFLRTLAPTITKAEVEAMCRRYPGFLRVALADPQAERRWFRRGWVTFERFVNIKEICWNLNNIRLRDCELGAIVNKDLTRRVRTVAGVASHKQVVRNDIKLAARMTHQLDSRNGLWEDQTDSKKETQSFGLVSANPVLENITDYLIEEASAEEEELLGLEGETGGQASECTVERDEGLIRVLDRLLLYLRIVFSIDYYNHCEYPQEDEMPNRCGLIHVRGAPPTQKVTQDEIHDYCKQFEQKISSLVTPNNVLSPEEIVKHGAKDADIEVEKFIQSNTQELSKDKWLCPLSGKKFKGPDFVKKHIQNKHAEKVQEVIKEVEYFNNYLADPRRPMLPEHPTSKPAMKREPEPYAAPVAAAPPFAPPGPAYGYAPRGGFGGYGGYGGYRGMRGGFRGRGHPPPVHELRPVVHYRDLDAPRELDEFI